jgi:hypothetical protein
VTGTPSSLTDVGATLNGTVNPNGSQITDCHFSISPGGSIPCAQQVGAGAAPLAVSAPLSGLTASTTYTVVLVASNAQGSSSGAPVTFTTPAVPSTRVNAPLAASALKLSPTRFRRGRRAAAIARAKRLPASTTISFTLSQAATVTLSFEVLETGVTVGHRCVAISKRNRRGKACKRDVAVPHHLTLSASADADRIAFDGILSGGSPLAPGNYRLSLTARNASGSATAPQHPDFTLLG